MTDYTTKDYNMIYLQKSEFPETTWCVDQINDDDIEYLRATPKQAAADAMYEALKSRHSYGVARYWKRTMKPKRFWVRYKRLIHGKERAALALADGEKDGG